MDPTEVSAIVASLFAGASSILANAAEGTATDLMKNAANTLQRKTIEIWQKIRGRGDEELDDAMRIVARAPDDERRVAVIASILLQRLQNDPDLLGYLRAELSNSEALQEIKATNGAVIERVHQDMSGSGSQTVTADRSGVRDVQQTRRR